MSDLVKFEFRGNQLDVVKDGDRVLVSVKAVCRALGLSHAPQMTKLSEQTWSRVTMIVTPDSRGRPQKHFTIPHDRVPMWLAGISASKVSPSVRPWLLEAQEQIAQALSDHFYPKVSIAEPPRSLSILRDDPERTRIMRAMLESAARAQGVSKNALMGEVRRIHRCGGYLMLQLWDFQMAFDRLLDYINGRSRFIRRRALPPHDHRQSEFKFN